MTFLLLYGRGPTDTLVCIADNKIVFWMEYSHDYVAAFHDHSTIEIGPVSRARVLDRGEAFSLLQDCSRATSKTAASRYSLEIDEFIAKEFDENQLPF